MQRRRLLNVTLALLGLVIAVLAVVMTPASASAAAPASPAAVPALGDCKDAPMPARPLGNPMAPGKPHNSTQRDPFAKDSEVTIAQAYGNGYSWVTYDNGCKPGDGMLPSVFTGLANMGLEFPSTWVAWGREFQTSVLTPDSWIGKADPAIAAATTSVAEGFWFPWLPVAGLVVVSILFFRSRSGDFANVMTGLGWSFIVLVIVSWVVNYPTEAPRVLDDGIATATTAVGNAFSGEPSKPDAVSSEDEKRIARGDTPKENKGAAALAAMERQWDEIDRQTSYRTWLTGALGDADSATAKKYGPQIFKATHFTWEENEQYNDDPDGEGKKIVERKQKSFEEAANKVKDEDPIAYDYLTGNRYMERIGVSITGAFVTVVCVAFLLLASVGLAAAYVVVRLIVPFAPAAGPIFLIDAFRNMVMDKVKRVAALIVMGPIYLIVGLVVLKINSAILGAEGLALIWKIFCIGMVGWMAWKLTKPAALGGQSFGVGRMIRQAAATAAGVRLGRGKKNDNDNDDEGSNERPDRDPQVYRRSRQDSPVFESRGLPPGSTGGHREPLDIGEVKAESYPVAEGTFVRRERAGVPANRREALALSSTPHDATKEPVATDPVEQSRARPFVSDAAPNDERIDREYLVDDQRIDREYLVDADRQDTRAGSPLALPPASPVDDTSRQGEAAGSTYDGRQIVGEVEDTPQRVQAERPQPGTAGWVPQLDEETTDVKALPADSSVPVSGSDAAVGRVMDSSETVPENAHEANLTYDPEGRPVFAVYRPASMRSTDV